jgi:CelD/BcsL family acetyltransferase involved in cellulose biosynthesis
MERHRQQRVQLALAASQDEWERLCVLASQATAFHRYDFLNSVAPLLNCRFIPLMVLFQRQAVGVAPLLVKRLGPFCTINWVPFPYLGPLVPAELLPATLSALRLEAARRRAVNHQQSFSEEVVDIPVDGFEGAMDRTFVVPLLDRSDEDLLAAMRNSRRKQILRAQDAGFEICPAVSTDFRLMDVWSKQVYSAQGLPAAYRVGTYGRIFDDLHDAPGVLFQTARLEGRTVAVQVVFSFAGRAFGWQVAADPSYRALHPQALLAWQALLWARNSGAIELDMVGAPNAGIAVYKSEFGALERRYTVLNKQLAPHRMALSALSRLRRR